MDISIRGPEAVPPPAQLAVLRLFPFHLFRRTRRDSGTCKLECLPAALAVAPLHLSARGEEKIERAELAAADRSCGEFEIVTDRRQCYWDSATQPQS